MSLENFTKKIESKSIESKEEKLYGELSGMQYYYSVRVYEGKIPGMTGDDASELKLNKEKGEKAFTNILLKYSDIESDILSSYCARITSVPLISNQRELAEYKKHNPLFISYENRILEEVFSTYNTHFPLKDSYSLNKWLATVLKIIEKQQQTLPLPTTNQTKDYEKKLKEESSKETSAGLIQYEVRIANNPPKELVDLGITKGSLIARVHFEPLFKQKSGNKKEVKNIFSSESLKKLAQELKSKHSDVKLIIANSWILDTPIAERIGFQNFKTYKGSSAPLDGEEFWGQFITESGEVNYDRMRKFLKTGKPPFRPKEGYILAEEFKKKYSA